MPATSVSMPKRALPVTMSVASCGGDTFPLGVWRAALEVPGGELPFSIDFVALGDTPEVYYVNGAERVPVDQVRVDGEKLVLAIRSFDSRIEAIRSGERMVGALVLTKRGGVPQVIPFSAVHGRDYRFFDSPPAATVDVSGRWAVTFSDDDGDDSVAIGEFRQDGNHLLGTFRTPTGDYRFLEGGVWGDEMSLSCFDGGHAFLFTATLADKELRGDFWSGSKWHESFVARRDEDATLPDAMAATSIRPGYDGISFELPDQDGNTVALDDERFADKVVVVTLAGSWCPNCHDEASYLARYYDANRDRGVEVISLMFEHYRDFDKAARQVAHYRERHDIAYTTVVAGYSDKKEAAKTLPMIDHILAYPTTLLIDRNGVVRSIHTGFDGPGTGASYEAYTTDFERRVDELLAEPRG